MAAADQLLQNARVDHFPRLTRWATLMAVPLVVSLAYLDLRRDQARAVDEFTAEQKIVAAAFAASLSARLDSGEALYDGMTFPDAPVRALVLDGERRFREIGGARAGSLADGQLPDEIRALLSRMAGGEAGAMT